ncbi:peptidylprolyl isomerase [Alkalihalobacillus sp. BA299]|uniref:peptidylprolyl isomerase n=1 Tax=Alkalihalobacillus sp. BA299 TaxID=2815938 RepID=UPI001ADC46C4|nr:peptidylprolyl isomerase [Alkalihalobacillus sp. BA299]
MKNSIFIAKKVLPFLIALTLGIAAGCGTSTNEPSPEGEGAGNSEIIEQASSQDNPIVTITMENNDQIIIELFPTIAPNTVKNFVSLIKEGFYNGVIFHRVIPGFMVQGGDPEGTGIGGPGYSIAGEFNANDFDNPLKHERGIISMARTNDPNSAGSQFFIMVEEAPHLDGQYAAFGKVIEGMETVDQIVQVDRNAQDKPNEDQKMITVSVETHGVKYGSPEIIE